MDDHEQERDTQDQPGEGQTTSPEADQTSDASSPRGGGEVDEEAVERSEEGLDQAGGGH